MYCYTSIQGTPAVDVSQTVARRQRRAGHGSLGNITFSYTLRKSTLSAKRRHQPLPIIVASAESTSSSDFINGGTPLEPSSPEGKLLSSVLQNKQHLFHFAVSEQLNELASDRDRAVVGKTQTSGSNESVLHRRIAEIKEENCQTAIEDVMYMSIVHKFSEIEVPMVPKLSKYNTEIWTPYCRELEAVHSLEAQELIREHLTAILAGNFSAVDGMSTSTTADSLHLGRIYTLSIMFGYFLKSACLRHELEMKLGGLDKTLQPLEEAAYLSVAELLTVHESTDSTKCNAGYERLKSYVNTFDSESFQRCARIKSKEAMTLIKKQTWALFGGVKFQESVVTFQGLERMVLEAVSFGSFLWEVEQSVDSVYQLKDN